MVNSTMKTAVMTGLRKVEMQTRQTPVPNSNEVLVKLECVGICGSDVHYYEYGKIADQIVETPFVLGHEAAGTVVGVGADVKHLKEGERVALEPGISCGVCEHCRTGRYNLCQDMRFFATPPIDGVFSEYVAFDASLCFKLPDNVSAVEGALIEPLAVGFHAAELSEAKVGQSAVITGAGCVGLMTLLALRARGVTRIYMVDIIESRLNKALELGADAVINGSKQDTVEEIMRLTDGKGCDIVIETAGAQVTSAQSILIVKVGGTIVFVGFGPSEDITLPMSIALNKEIVMKTIRRYRNVYPTAIEMVASGKINLNGIVTNTYEFDDLPKALEECVCDKAGIIKAVVKL